MRALIKFREELSKADNWSALHFSQCKQASEQANVLRNFSSLVDDELLSFCRCLSSRRGGLALTIAKRGRVLHLTIGELIVTDFSG